MASPVPTGDLVVGRTGASRLPPIRLWVPSPSREARVLRGSIYFGLRTAEVGPKNLDRCGLQELIITYVDPLRYPNICGGRM